MEEVCGVYNSSRIELSINEGFTSGSTNSKEINGQFFADDEDVVLVTIK
jgi:hypothetical protein